MKVIEVIENKENFKLIEKKINKTEKKLSNIEKQGKLVFFASSEALIERAVYWAKQIDKPIDSAEKQYFIYQPQAR